MSKLYKFNQLVGDTPLIQIENRIYAKFEVYNPSGSVKDRMVTYIINDALKKNIINEKSIFIEATSGNTGISLAMMGSKLSNKVKIIMPHNMSSERKKMLRFFGAELIEVGFNDFQSAIDLRDSILASDERYWSPLQFSNKLNIECHRRTTGPEILSSVYHLFMQNDPTRTFDTFIHGSGTGGTLMGVWEYFNKDLLWVDKKGIPKKIDFVLTTPAEPSSMHGIQGINDGANFLLNKHILDDEIPISTDSAVEYMHQLGLEKGLMVGISSAANILAAKKWKEKRPNGGAIVTMLCDRGERYL